MSTMSHAVAIFRGQETPHFNIMGRRKIWFAISGVLIAVSIVGLFWPGLNLSIDFEGGALITVDNPNAITVEQVEDVLTEAGVSGAEVQEVGGDTITIRTESFGSGGAQDVIASIAEAVGVPQGEVTLEDVGPTWGAEISRKALTGMVVVLAAITLYITLRFEWKMAIGAIIALFHDVAITAGVYVFTGREVTPETVIAVLTIFGFSLYDTVVIYDRIRENAASLAAVGKEGYDGVVNRSMNEVLMRSINTSVVVLLPILSLLLFGGETLKDFAFAMFIGTLTGAYSSIFIAAPALVVLKERDPRYRQLRERSKTRQVAAAAAGARATGSVEADETAAAVSARPKPSSGAGRSSKPPPKSKRKPPKKPKRR
ncbi:MAG: protein translocase subunit SecF [Actinomycetota bacterium]